jgi:hypothetical protein
MLGEFTIETAHGETLRLTVWCKADPETGQHTNHLIWLHAYDAEADTPPQHPADDDFIGGTALTPEAALDLAQALFGAALPVATGAAALARELGAYVIEPVGEPRP